MAIGDDYSDILGSDTLPVRQKPESNSFSFPVKTIFTLALLLFGYIIAARAWRYILRWREKSYRLSLRRRHGIPDNDHRPFNVAYAAVQRAKEQKEKENARIRRADLAAASAVSSQESLPDQVRHRPGNQRGVDSSRSGAPVGGFPGRYNPISMNSYLTMPSVSQSQSNRVTFADGYNTSASPLDAHAELASPSKRSGRKSLGILKLNDDLRKRERANDDEVGDLAKKTRLEGDESVDGDEEAEWQNSHDLRDTNSIRGSKRGLGEDDEGDLGSSKRTRGKRQRKVSGDKESSRHYDMDIDAEGDPKSPYRGKKRDRDEAGSSDGGELEQQNDDAEFEIEEEKARQRKRRNKRRSDANTNSRGKKRDRDLEDELGESDDESGTASQRMLRKKRGKRTSDDEKLSDVSMEDSSSISTKGRKIGETWTSNGVQYKIGPNGQRLRFELVKKARQKFVMPIDSVHPDRRANLEVYVEAWLTEEEYREAKAQYLLSWQESPKGSAEPETPPPTTPVISSTRTGKHLLWESTMSTPVSQAHDNPFESAKTSTQQMSITNNAAASRRIASAVRSTVGGSKPPVSSNIAPPSPSLMDSTNMRSPRTYKQFSKWEKQDLEAKAMMRMRESNRKKEEEKEKEMIAPAPPAVPKITLTPAADTGLATKLPGFSLPGTSTGPKLSFNAPATSSPLAGGENKTEAAKPPTSATPSFSFTKPSAASTPAPAQVPSTSPASQTPVSANVSHAPPANAPAFSFGPLAGTSNAAIADKPKPTVGLGLPSSGLSTSPAPQPAASFNTPNVATPSSTPAPPKFSFNLPPKPAAAPSVMTEQNKDVPASNGAPSAGSLLSRLGGSAPTSQSNTSAPTMPPTFSFGKPVAPSSSNTAPSPSPAGSAFSAALSPSPFGGASSTSNTAAHQSSQPATSSAAAAPIKFSFSGGTNKTFSSSSAPFGNTNINNASTTTTSVTPSSLSGALNPVPTSSNATSPAPSPFGLGNNKLQPTEERSMPSTTPAPKPNFGTPTSSSNAANPAPPLFGSGNNKPTGEGSTSSTTPALKFNFGTPTSSWGATPNNGNVPGAGQQPATSNPTPSAAPSPFGTSSAFGGNSAFGSGNSAPNKQDNAPKSAFAFGTSSTPSPFGTASSGNNNVFGNSTSPFGAKPTRRW
ncbi:hypothetical protein GGU10DRAFT_121684 [Lentinula aff. detonsa]|uniref:Uncharacterized protein n=1 Tax=Lentinula aff. detonsa TaxID=2804958 RepID=A0AA38KXU4_9AGAR|nr:hypothetical protein GGU10DRAFT_121684 [Lentinula aff. detonsa]